MNKLINHIHVSNEVNYEKFLCGTCGKENSFGKKICLSCLQTITQDKYFTREGAQNNPESACFHCKVKDCDKNCPVSHQDEITTLKDQLHRRNALIKKLRENKKKLLPDVQDITASDLQIAYQYLADWQEQMRRVIEDNSHSNTKAETFIMRLISSLLLKVDVLQWSKKIT